MTATAGGEKLAVGGAALGVDDIGTGNVGIPVGG